MQKRCLGSTAIEVSILGLGTVKFGRNQGVKYPTSFSLPTDQELQALLALAKESGINLLDTAPAYGSSEERLGRYLRGQRDQWVISTKVGEAFIEGKSYFDFSAEKIIVSIEHSLKTLLTDYLDIVLVHSNGEDEGIINEDAVFDTLAMLKKQGKIRAFGMSTKTRQGSLLTIDHADVAMVTFNPQEQVEREMIAYAHQKKKGVLIKKALASGNINPSEALPFVLKERGVTSVIIGTINPLHLRQSVEWVEKIGAV